MAEKDELDQLLDSALASYSDAEPLAGIEARVMRRVEVSRRKRWLWWFAPAVPAAIALLVLLTSREAVQPSAPVRPPEVAQQQKPVAAPVPPPVEKQVHRATHARGLKRERFPASAPLTAQERSLLELARVAPEVLLVRPPDAIEIAPIEIKPLDTNGTI